MASLKAKCLRHRGTGAQGVVGAQADPPVLDPGRVASSLILGPPFTLEPTWDALSKMVAAVDAPPAPPVFLRLRLLSSGLKLHAMS